MTTYIADGIVRMTLSSNKSHYYEYIAQYRVSLY